MDASVTEFNNVGDILILPLFKGVDKAPNNALAGSAKLRAKHWICPPIDASDFIQSPNAI